MIISHVYYFEWNLFMSLVLPVFVPLSLCNITAAFLHLHMELYPNQSLFLAFFMLKKVTSHRSNSAHPSSFRLSNANSELPGRIWEDLVILPNVECQHHQKWRYPSFIPQTELSLSLFLLDGLVFLFCVWAKWLPAVCQQAAANLTITSTSRNISASRPKEKDVLNENTISWVMSRCEFARCK